jgi:two-component system sensor histidine kinase GlrK
MADREKLTTIADNLLSNAIKFSPPGGEVHLTLKTRNGMAQLEVRDSGPGFHPDDKAQIFKAFYQGRTVAEGHVKGSGLGLAIAREYAAIHGGTLEIIEEDTPGGGIRLNLPIERE